MARSSKHDHALAILSHTKDGMSVLLGCSVLGCPHIETRHLKTSKVNIAPRKYRPMTKEEFIETVKRYPHLCCPR